MEFIKDIVNYDDLFKFIVVGASSVGKTLFMQRIKLYNDYHRYKNISKAHIETIGIDFSVFGIQLAMKDLKTL